MRLADTIKIPFQCPQCGQEHPRTPRQLKVDPVVHCPCGATFTVQGDSSATTGALDRLDRTMKKLRKAPK